jgi:hypothetical protein
MTDIDDLMDDDFLRIVAIEDATNAEVLMRSGGAFAALLQKAFDEAKGALEALISIDTEDMSVIRRLQWKVTRYDDLVRWIKEIMADGEAAQEGMSEEEAVSLQRLIRGEPEEKDA